jgi:crotonobetainyl-CoA:carnitine CoA-transferase CaiB-like acyl-CoA transferase
MMRPVKVLDLGSFLAGPLVATFLGDLGADVIKVERPGLGDRARYYGPQPPGREGMGYRFQVEARNKRSITLELQKPEGRDLLKRLVGWADVLVENFRPGTMARWGLGYDDLLVINQRLVYVSVSGYGQEGPYRDRPAYDQIALAVGGLTNVTGFPDRPPVLPGFPLGDYLGGLWGALGALEALRRRDAPGGSGHGDHIDLALYEGVLRLSSPLVTAYAATGYIQQREGSLPTPGPEEPEVLWGYLYESADGRWISNMPHQFDPYHQRQLEIIGRTDLLDDPRFTTYRLRQKNFRVLDEAIREWIRRTPAGEVLERYQASGIPVSLINDAAAIAADPHIAARGSLVEVKGADGEPLLMQAPVPRFASGAAPIRWSGQPLGAANAEVYAGLLGLADTEIERLREDGVI